MPFSQTVGGKLKSRDFIYHRILITVISLFPVYLEWTTASLRTNLLQITREQLFHEVAAMYKVKVIAGVRFNIFVFMFFLSRNYEENIPDG